MASISTSRPYRLNRSHSLSGGDVRPVATPIRSLCRGGSRTTHGRRERVSPRHFSFHEKLQDVLPAFFNQGFFRSGRKDLAEDLQQVGASLQGVDEISVGNGAEVVFLNPPIEGGAVDRKGVNQGAVNINITPSMVRPLMIIASSRFRVWGVTF